MARITADARNKLKSSAFGLPAQRKYPLDTKARAANAKARATQMVAKGKLAASAAAQIRAKANAKLTGVTHDLNAATLGARAVPRAGWADNRNPARPYQEDINSWKSMPARRPGPFMSDSQGGKGATESGAGKSYSGQPKFGGTVAESANKKAAVKVSGGTPETGKNFKGQAKIEGTTGQGNGGGKRYANGSSSHDSMRTMIRDH